MNKTLQEIRDEYNIIASDWNGREETFMSGGSKYSEDHAHASMQIVEQAEILQRLINEFKEL